MAESIKNLSVNLNIHTIEEYLRIAQAQQVKLQQALDELILYFIHLRTNSMLLFNSSLKEVNDIKEILASKDFTTRSNFLTALTTVCYQSVGHRKLSHITEESYCPTEIVAAFHHELLSLSDHPIIFKAHLKQLAQMPRKELAVLLFCIKIFVPEIIIVNSFCSKKELSLLNALVNAPSVPTCLTFSGRDQDEMDSKEIEALLFCIDKTERLVLDDINMNSWTAEQVLRFVQAVKANKALHSISLANTQLNKCCMDPTKFGAILQLITLPQLTELNLQANNLDNLPQATFKILKKTITHTTIKPLGLELTLEKKGTSSNTGIFALSALELSTPGGASETYDAAP